MLLAIKEDFIAEGSEQLWEYLYREAYRYTHWGDNKYSRYLYTLTFFQDTLFLLLTMFYQMWFK